MVVIVLCSIPKGLFGPVSQNNSFTNADKLVHLVLFAVWAFLLASEWKNSRLLFKMIAILLFGTVFGFFIEGWQWLMPWGRSAEFGDVLADVAGILLGYGTQLLLNVKNVDK